MFKQKMVMEVKGREELYRLEVAPQSSLGELYDALSTMQSYVLEKMKEQDEKKKKEEKPKECQACPEEEKE